MRLLLVEDDRKVARVLSTGLREEGFALDVVHSGEMAEEMAAVNQYDAIVLDWMLPKADGLSVCRQLRERGTTTPILMLTARVALDDRLAGLRSGADDYLTKPFAFAELVERIRALLRRSELSRPPVLSVADVTLDPGRRTVTRAGTAVILTPKEFEILHLLMRHPGQIVTRARIAESIWQNEIDDLGNLIDAHVTNLRRKLERPGSPAIVLTVRGQGFRTEG